VATNRTNIDKTGAACHIFVYFIWMSMEGLLIFDVRGLVDVFKFVFIMFCVK